MTTPGLHLTDPDWDKAALDAVTNLGSALARTVCVARALVDNGRVVDVTGLERGVGLFCAKALDLPYEQGQAVRPHLAALLSEIEGLTAALRRMEAAPPQSQG
jgi:hypothetical protein